MPRPSRLIALAVALFASGTSASAADQPHWLKSGVPGTPLGADELAFRWLGTAGFEFRTAKATVLIDPYLTRSSLWRLLTRPAQADAAEIRRYVSRADAVFVGHSHFDHLLDAPTIAKQTGATFYGSADSVRVARTEGVPASQVVTLGDGGTVNVGDLSVTPVLSAHSDVPTQWFVAGDMPKAFTLPMSFLKYKHGPVFGFFVRWRGRSFYHCGSADFVESHLRGQQADIVLMCLAGWKSTPNLWSRLHTALHPQVVMPMHHDDFFRPLSAGYREVLFANAAEALAGIRAAMPEASVLPMAYLQDMRVSASH